MQADGMVPLGANDVQVWKVEARADGGLAAWCKGLLTDGELARWNRMRVGPAKNEFLVGRGCLRALLGELAGVAPRLVRLERGGDGKPWTEGVEFNVAHSQGVVLIALCRDAVVGIDLERVDVGIEALEIAENAFAQAEVTALRSAAAGGERAAAFYKCWTKKEAVTKALGLGLRLPLDCFSVPVDAENETAVRVRSHQHGVNEELYVREVAMEEGFVAAMALDSPGRNLSLLEWGWMPREAKYGAVRNGVEQGIGWLGALAEPVGVG